MRKVTKPLPWGNRPIGVGAAIGALALITGLLVVPPAYAQETVPPTESTEQQVDAPAEAAPTEQPDQEPAEETPEATPAPSGQDSKETKNGAPLLAEGEPTLSVTLAQKTGTTPFDEDDAPGNDSGPDNDVVRTNDSVTYTVGVRFEGGDHTAPTVTFTLPQGEELASLPPFCLDGSSVSPDTLPAPTVPVTATSWSDLPAQTVTCVVADQTQGTSLDYRFVSKVRPEVPNGTQLDPVVASATSDQVETPASSAPVTHSVSAAANFDVSKRRNSGTENSGPFYQYFGACSFDTTRSCVQMFFPLTMEGPAGGKGLTPLESPIVVTEDLSPEAFFGADVTSSEAWTAAGSGALEKYAPRLTSCGPASHLRGEIPEWKGGGDNAVRDSGTITCDQPTLGGPVDVTFTDADTTGYTVPSKTSSGAALPANSGFILSSTLRLEVPLDAVRDLGEQVDGTATLSWKNNYSKVDATGIDGSANQGEKPENNVRSGTTKLESGYGFTKGFSGITGAAGNTKTGSGGYTNWEFEGPPGSAVWHDGNTVVLPGQTVLSNVRVEQTLPPLTGTDYSRTFLGCDVWDDNKLGMPESFDFEGSSYTRVQLPSEGSPAWISSVNRDNSWVGTDSLDNLVVEYGYTDSPGKGENSSCDSGDWSTTPAGVSGSALVDGVWQGVNRVRFSFSTEAGNSEPTFGVNLSIAMRVLDGAGPNGTILPNWASLKSVPGVTDIAGVLNGENANESLSSYTPETNAGAAGDRLIVGQAAARLKKFVKNPATGEFTSSAVPQYTAGSSVEYRLNPSLTADISGSGTKQNVVVEDCLPRYQSFSSSVRESGAAISPVLIQAGAPADSDLTCSGDETYVKWDLGENNVGETIDPILYTVTISDTVRNDTFTNTALVSSPGDPSSADARMADAQIQVVVPTGIKIAKTVDKPTVEVNRGDLPNPRSFTWTIDFANIDSPNEVSDVDVIDVLPANDLQASSFAGKLRLDDVTVAAGNGIKVLYTKSPSSELAADPDHASNQGSGATVWCDAAENGGVVSGDGANSDCPSSLSEVTGLRFQRAGVFEPSDEMTVQIAMTPQDNAAGDVYENRTSGRVDGVTQPVGPAIRQVAVIASSVGDRVWEDSNGNGIQDDGEPGIAGFPVRLVGTDVDGNPVSLETETDADGLYKFENLASGTYRVIFDPNGLNSNTKFTSQHSGDDTGVDSDADPSTGQTQEFTLGRDSEDLTLDAGVVIDRNVDITLDKKFLGATDLDSDGRSTVTYELEATNNGTAEGPYDLTDTLQFGGDIEIGEVSVENTDPGDIPTNPEFDGQKNTEVVTGAVLPGGTTHTYLVTVEAAVATTITAEEAECEITQTESGSGFLNEAELSMNGVTVTDKACGEPPVPPTTPEDPDNPDQPGSDDLAMTGGQLMGLFAAAAVLLLAAGATLIVVRRRRANLTE